MGEGLYLCHVDVSVNVDALALFGKYHRHVEIAGYHTGDADTGGFNGHDFIDILVREALFELLAHLLKQVDVHLMIQKAIYFQDVAFFYDTVF